MISKSDFDDTIDFEIAIQASRLSKEIIKGSTFNCLMEITPSSQVVRDDALFINGRYWLILDDYMSTSRAFAVFNRSGYYYIMSQFDRNKIEQGNVPVVLGTSSQGYVFDYA